MHPLIYIDLPYLVVGRYLSTNSAETHCNQQCFKNCSDSNQIMCDYNTQSQNAFKKWKKPSPMARFELLTQCASRGGGGGAPDHSAIQWDDDNS